MQISKPGRPGVRMLLSVVLATAGLLAFAATASAARDPIGAGTTDLHMKHGFLRKLGNSEITVAALGAGTVDGNKIGLSVREGMLDPTNVEGHLEVRGGFKLARGNRGVPITEISVNTVKKKVYAKVAKAQMEFGDLGPLVANREGFGANFKAVQLTLTEKAARRISNRLGLNQGRRLAGGRVISNIYGTAQPTTVTLLPKGTATLKGDLPTLAKFAAKGVDPAKGIGVVAPAAQSGAVEYQFPIAAGSLAPDGSAGTVWTTGALKITKEAKSLSPSMLMQNIAVDFGAKTATTEIEISPAPPFPGAIGRSSIADITLPANSVTADPVARTITVKGAEARLQAVAASTLNSVFNQPAPEPPPSSNFVVGDLLGTFSLTVQAE